MSGYSIDGVLSWALNNMEGAGGLEFELFSCIADAIQLYKEGRGCGACEECYECYRRRQSMLSVSDRLYDMSDDLSGDAACKAASCADDIRKAFGVRPRGSGIRQDDEV